MNARYPHCLYFLELLQNANFRNAMAHPVNKVHGSICLPSYKIMLSPGIHVRLLLSEVTPFSFSCRIHSSFGTTIGLNYKQNNLILH